MRCVFLYPRPRGLTFTWWGCCGLCLWHEPTELAHSFLFCSRGYLCLHVPFNCISFHKFSRQLSVFSFCSSDFISALLVLSTICLFMKVSFSPNIIPRGWLGSMHQLINKLTAPGRWAFSYRKAVFGPLTCAIILVRAVHTKARNHWRVSTVDSKELTAFLYSVAVELWLGYRVQRASKPVKNSCQGWCLVS